MITRRHFVANTLSAPLAGLLGLGCIAAAGPAAAQKETTWEELIPKDWDPMKNLSVGNIGLVPEGSAKERDMMRQMREVWDNAPTVARMDGASVRLPGYVVPLEEVNGGLKEFLLVPYFGACIHSPPPPSNQVVHVLASEPLKGFRTMDTVWVSGTLKINRQDSAMGASSYQIKGPTVEPYVAKARR
jgi:uncharacterized protein